MKWEKKEIPQEVVKEFAAKYGCDILTASILVRRGITQGEEVRYFLEAEPRHLRNPFELPGMEDAVDRIISAKEEGEKVLIFGDRDVDGVTSTALLAGCLGRFGMDVSWRIPVGDEPYGLSIPALEDFAAADGTLVITVDCGVSNVPEVTRANELNIDVIITDHHNPPEVLPPALAIVNAKLPGSAYPFRDLCGCGTAYKLASALRFALKSQLYGQSLCLLNIRRGGDRYCIEIGKMRNLALIETMTETIFPGTVRIGETRLPAFLEGQQIFVWDGGSYKRAFTDMFGTGVAVQMMDIAPEIGKEIPHAAGKSLAQLRQISRLARYSSADMTELEVFVGLFVSFIQRREQLFTPEDAEDLQLASLGTVADIVPLRDENRIIVRNGLAGFMEKPRAGVSDLLFKLGLAGRRIGTADIAWQVCPAINAAGRMGSPEKAVALLLEQDLAARDKLADELIAMNEDRKKLGGGAWALVEPAGAESFKTYGGKFVLAYGAEIYRGITGLMANRLISRFKVPSMVISFGETVYTGSMRSTRGYDLRPFLERCEDLLIDWGGHTYAAGFSLEKAQWPAFLARLTTAAKTIAFHESRAEEIVAVDAELPRRFLTPLLFKIIDKFEPYGEGNESLTFLARGLWIADIVFMGKTEAKHVKLTLDTGSTKWTAVYWQAADKVKKEFTIRDAVDVVFKLTRNWYNGVETPQLVITDIRKSKPLDLPRGLNAGGWRKPKDNTPPP